MTERSIIPDVAELARWMRSWVGDEGQIRGFHNHSVWGTNPATFLDFTSGHQAFSAPALIAFAEALAQRFDERGFEMWCRMMRYQAFTAQPDGQFAHIGFQVGESATAGLIHNMVGDIGLLEALAATGHLLDADERSQILAAVRRNLDACAVYGGGRPTAGGTCNQEYARVWAKLRYSELSGDGVFDGELEADLDALIRLCSRRGVPDGDCVGAYRVGADRDGGGILEPAEYYGLMIVPLMLGARRFSRPDFGEEAAMMCRHVARSSWRDDRGLTRYHRYWYAGEGVERISTTPMLIAGMGLTLRGLDEVLVDREDAELRAFRAEVLATYAGYQTAAGFFASATGWHNEADVAPSTAWHAHDLMALVHALPLPEDFWERALSERAGCSVLLSDRASWVEEGQRWAILSPWTAGDLSIYGRKDRDAFGRSYFSWTDKEPLAEELEFPGVPTFFAADDGMYLLGSERPFEIDTIGPLPYRGPVDGG